MKNKFIKTGIRLIIITGVIIYLLLPRITKILKLKELANISNTIIIARKGKTIDNLIKNSLQTSKKILLATRWNRYSGEETDFVKLLALFSAIYNELQKNFTQKEAYELTKEILLKVAIKTQFSFINKIEPQSGMDRIMAFNNIMDQNGVPRFHEREYLIQNNDTCHFIIKRCLFNEFFTAAGTPELTSIFCESDQIIFKKAFPDFEFNRGDSWNNTIAGGKKSCTFIFSKKTDKISQTNTIDIFDEKKKKFTKKCNICSGCGLCVS